MFLWFWKYSTAPESFFCRCRIIQVLTFFILFTVSEAQNNMWTGSNSVSSAGLTQNWQPALRPQFIPGRRPQFNPARRPPVNHQNFRPFSFQQMPTAGNQPKVFGGGKLGVLTTLFQGIKNTGLERSIAGEILQRIIKTALKDIVVPFKRDVFSVLTP